LHQARLLLLLLLLLLLSKRRPHGKSVKLPSKTSNSGLA
jgi:hypothetical protein